MNAGTMTPVERRIVAAYANGEHIADIATRLRIKPATVSAVVVEVCEIRRNQAAAIIAGRAQPPARSIKAEPTSGDHRNPGWTRNQGLTVREKQIIAAAAEGLSIYDIGPRLGLSHGTVKSHLTNAYRKLGATNRTGAVAQAIRIGEIPPPSMTPEPTQQPHLILPDSQLKVLQLVTEGLSYAAIGELLNLSEEGVKSRATRVFVKLGVNRRAHAAAAALRLGLVKVPA